MAQPKLYTAEERIDRANYLNHKSRARRRGIDFTLTLEAWLDIWISSGHYHERGVRKGQYVMARLGPDIGPYSIGNVVIQLAGQNNSDGHKGIIPNQKYITEEFRKRKSEQMKQIKSRR
jgi:hypothetical protein